MYFTSEDWARINETYTKWWNGTLGRPVIKGIEWTGPAPEGMISQANVHDFSKTPEDIINTLDVAISRQKFHGDAFPMVGFECFGPGVVAAFLGCELDNSSGRVWFHDKRNLTPDQLHLEFDPNNKWLCRLKDIYAAGNKKWNGSVLMGMTDLGGELDVLASFLGTENLLYSLYDYPEDIDRLAKEIHELWFKCYNELQSVLLPINPGNSDWSGLYSKEPSYVQQCDFSYMISPDMFEQFVLPYLDDSAKRLTHTLYHLDGVGELPHLDMIMSIPEIQAVQWVPGDGKESPKHWREVYEKIDKAGKKMHIVSDYLDVMSYVDPAKCYFACSPSDFPSYDEFLRVTNVK